MTRRLLSAGEVVVDLVLSVPALPQRGGDVVARDVATEVGGAFNVMAAAARQQVPVTYAGLLGTGPMATLAAAALSREGIGVVLGARPGIDTGTIVTLVEPGGERTFVTTLGAEAQLGEADLAAVAVRPDDVVHLSGYGLAYPCNGPTLVAWLATLPRTVTLVLDPGPLVGDIPPELLAPVLDRCDWVSCTAAEARVLVTDRGAASAASDIGDMRAIGDDAVGLTRRLVDRVRAGVVLRSGDRGAVVATPDLAPVHVSAVVVSAVDLNGAGDAHVGSFIASLATTGASFDPSAAVRRANAAAAFAVTSHGPATAPTTVELDGFPTPTNGGGGID